METTQIDLTFNEHLIPGLRHDGRWCWPARHVGAAIGYSDSGRAFAGLVHQLTHEDVLEAGVDFEVLAGASLRVARESRENILAPKARAVLVLFESGLNACLMRSTKPAGRQLWRRVTREILPQIHRDGRYSPERQVVDGQLVESAREQTSPAGADEVVLAQHHEESSQDSMVGPERRRGLASLARAAELAELAHAPRGLQFDLALEHAGAALGVEVGRYRGALASDFDDADTVKRPDVTQRMVDAAAALVDDPPRGDDAAFQAARYRRLRTAVLAQVQRKGGQTRSAIMRALRATPERWLLLQVVTDLIAAGAVVERAGPAKAKVLWLA